MNESFFDIPKMMEGFGGEVKPLPSKDEPVYHSVLDNPQVKEMLDQQERDEYFRPKIFIQKLLAQQISLNEFQTSMINSFINKAGIDSDMTSSYNDVDKKNKCLYCDKLLTISPIEKENSINRSWIRENCKCELAQAENKIIEEYNNMKAEKILQLEDLQQERVEKLLEFYVKNEIKEYKEEVDTILNNLIRQKNLLNKMEEVE